MTHARGVPLAPALSPEAKCGLLPEWGGIQPTA